MWDGLPTPNPDFLVGPARDGATDVAFGYMRLRLEPSVVFGSNPFQPVAALRTQIDMLDNVVFGDNARLNPTPVFTNDPGSTNIFGGESPPILLRRLWLEFMTPIGQIRIGRWARRRSRSALQRRRHHRVRLHARHVVPQ